MRLADPEGETGGRGRAFSKRAFEWCDCGGVLEVSVTIGGSSASFLWGNRGTGVLHLGRSFTTLSRLRVFLVWGVSWTAAGGLRPVAFRMRFTMPEVAESFVRDGASLRWSKAGLYWSTIGLLVGMLLVYPFGAANIDVTIILNG